MLETFVSVFLISILTTLFARWAGKRWPASIALARGSDEFKAAARSFRWWQIGSTVLYLLLWFPVAFAFWLPLRWLAEWRFSQLPQDGLYYETDLAIWFLPAFFCSIAASAYILMWLYKRLLGERFEAFMSYLDAAYGYNQRRVFPLFVFLTSILVGTFILLSLDWYHVVQRDRIVANGFLSLGEEVFPYAEAGRIELASSFVAPNGKVVKKTNLRLVMTDGRIWTTHQLPGKLSSSEVRSIAARIANAGGVPLEYKPRFEEGEL